MAVFYFILVYFIAGRPHNTAINAAIVYCSIYCCIIFFYFTCADSLNWKCWLTCVCVTTTWHGAELHKLVHPRVTWNILTIS